MNNCLKIKQQIPVRTNVNRLTDQPTNQPTNSMDQGPSDAVTELVKKFPTIYGIQRFIIMFKRAHHWSLT